MAKGKGGFIGQDGLNAPDAPTGVSGTAGDEQVEVSWTAPSDVGGSAITGYSVQSDNGGQIPSYTLITYDPDKNFSYNAQAGVSWGFSLGDSGTKLYVISDGSSVIYQYTLSTAYDLSTASYASISVDVSSTVATNSARDITFKPDGTKVYVSADGTVDTIYQFSLSTAWDISTASYDSKSFSIATQDGTLYGFTWNSDGTKIVAAGSSNDTLYQYSLSTAYDISTASYDSVSYDAGTLLSEAAPIALQYSSDGTILYLSGNANNRIFYLELSTAYDLSTATYNGAGFQTDQNDSGNTNPYGMFAKPDNKSFFVLDYGDNLINQFDQADYPTASPVTITGLTNGTSYTFNVWAINAFGWSSPSDASDGIAPVAAPRSLFASEGIIDYVQVDTTGNATDFGDLHAQSQGGGSGSSTTRALFFGWDTDTRTRIDTVEISTTGNATDFGDMSNPRRYNAALSNSTRTVWGTGDDETDSVVMEYSTIASAGNAADFGDATVFAFSNTGTASPTRGIFAAGQTTGSTSTVINTMMYVTIASTGNATDFGDLTLARRTPGGVSSSTRAVFGGGRDSSNTNTNVMDYVTIASTGNATDFGDLAIGGFGNNEGSGSNTRGIFGPGFGSGSPFVGIAYITIASTGNSTTFGNLTSSNRYNSMSASNAHGGLQ